MVSEGGGSSLVIMPTYNEAANLRAIGCAVLEQGPFNLLIVDDGSPDGTGVIADEMTGEFSGRVHVIHRAGKLGLGTAYKEGFRHALDEGYDYVFQMDADFSHDPACLPLFLEKLQDGADVVLGSRYVRGGSTPDWPLRRRLLSRGGSLYARGVLGLPVRDLTGGFKGFRRGTLAALDLDAIRSNGYAFQIEVTYHCCRQKFRVVETPITFTDRTLGTSKMGWKIAAEAVRVVWGLRATASRNGAGSSSRRFKLP